MPYSIMIDAGHGGNDPGAVYKGRREKDDNLALAMEVGRILSENGVDVLYTRTTDDYISPFERARLANEAKVDFFISFHRNSSPEMNQYNGVEVLVYDKNGIKYEMAQNSRAHELGFREIESRQDRALLCCETKMPALLIETGFLNLTKIISFMMKKMLRSRRLLPGRFLELWISSRVKNLCITVYRLELFANGKMRIECFTCFRKKVIRHIFCRMENFIRFR